MHGLYLFLAVAGAAVLIGCVCENRNAWAFKALAFVCAAAAAYSFAQQAWPFAIIESIFAIAAMRRWRMACAPKMDSDSATLKSRYP
ncbi:MAG: hypothetical protein KGL46_05530 [Hyphomicrobiales bacterium]|nr:hypothetical protein [Hyphomicrobiales bacterium]